MNKPIILSLAVLLTLTSLPQAKAISESCGIYDVAGRVELEQGQVVFKFTDGPSREVSLKVLDAPQSLKLLQSFSVKLKLDVQRITGRNLEARYVKTKEDIQVFPSEEDLQEIKLEEKKDCQSQLSMGTIQKLQ